MLKKLIIFAGLTSLMGFARWIIGALIAYVLIPEDMLPKFAPPMAPAPMEAAKIIYLTDTAPVADCDKLRQGTTPETSNGITLYKAESDAQSAALLLNATCLTD